MRIRTGVINNVIILITMKIVYYHRIIKSKKYSFNNTGRVHK